MSKFSKSALALVISSSFCLIACDDNSTDSDPVAFSLSVSDAPVDNASKVVVCFSEITLKNEGKEFILPILPSDTGVDECLDQDELPITENLAINLLDAQGSDSIEISETIDVEPGEYQMTVLVPDFSGSYVMTDEDGDGVDEKVLVEVPPEKLHFKKFTVTQGGDANFTLEFDLRKSMNIPNKEGAAWHLKPNGVRLIDNNEAGHIAGIVPEPSLCEGEDAATFVYLYEGIDLATENLGDMYYHAESGDYLGEGEEPVASTEVITEVQSDGTYEIGFVATGDYSLALTCSTDLPESLEVLVFDQVIETTVVEKQTAHADFL